MALILACMLTVATCRKEPVNKVYNVPGKEKNKGGESGSDSSVTLIAMSFNIRHTGEAADTGDKHWNNRKAAVVNMIKKESPDLIGFQECTKEQKEYLAGELNDYGFYAPTNNKVIAWKKSVFGDSAKQNAYYWVTDQDINKSSAGWDGDTRATAWVKLVENSTGKTVFFFDTHLSVTGRTARIEGAKLNAEQMRSICGTSAIQLIVGDMNTDESACHDNYCAYLQDARKESPESDNFGTYNGWTAPKSIIDYIYFKNVTPLRYATLTGENYGVKIISDHYPIIFKFEMKK